MIDGLLVKPETAPAGMALPYWATSPKVAEAVGVTLEAYRELGYAPEVEEATESLTTAFNNLASTGHDGRFFVSAPVEISFDYLLAVVDDKRQKNVYPVSRLPGLWSPQSHLQAHKGYTSDQLNAGPLVATARLAIFNEAETGVDPILHFLNKPYDTCAKHRWNSESETTQLEAVEEAKTSFVAKHEGFDLDTLDHRDFVIMALMDRVRGVGFSEQILSRGCMRIAKLGRRVISLSGPIDARHAPVGSVFSYGGQLVLDAESGFASERAGIGLSVAQKSGAQ